MTVRLTKDTVTASLKQIQQRLDRLPEAAYKEWIKDTPVRSGNARRKTKLKGDKIEANYPYAQRLDEGWSKQSPDGMSKPVEEFIKRYIAKLGR